MRNFIRKLAVVIAIVVGSASFAMGGITLASEKLVTDVKLELRGDGEGHARRVLKMSTYGTNLLPTGIAALEGEEIKVHVKANGNNNLPYLAVTQQQGHWNKKWIKFYKLSDGVNKITIPNLHDSNWKVEVIKGGALYLTYPYTKEQVPNPPEVTIEGGHDYPLFTYGKDNEEKFLEELKKYKTKLDENPEEYVDIVEIVNDYAIINGNMEAANVYLEGETTPSKVLEITAERFKKYFELAGVKEEGEGVQDNDLRKGARANLRLMQPWALAYAASDHTGFQQSAINVLFSGGKYGWAIPHELGHHFDMAEGHIKESTNNMWANYDAVVMNGENDRVTDENYENIFKKVGAHNHTELDRSGTNSLAMWWQLYLMDEDFWVNYNTLYRDGFAKDLGLEYNERMVVVSSRALDMDVSEFFYRHKFIGYYSYLKVKETLKNLGIEEKEDIKPWYYHTKALEDRKAVFIDAQTPQIESVKVVNNKIQVNISAMDENNQKALLGYEVLKDGKVVGFTKTNTFTTLEDNDNKSHTYKVRALDIQQNKTDYSAEFEFQGQQPYIEVIKSTIIPVGKMVDRSVTSYVNVTDVEGNKMQPVTNFKNIGNKAGYYTINYSATGKTGDITQRTVRFHIVSEVIYASELDAINNGRIIEYRVDKNYDVFESFVEVDKDSQGKSKFQVYVDDVKKFDSGDMTKDSKQQYVKLEIPENKKVELIVIGDTQGATWKDAKFAKINPRTDEIKMINEIKLAAMDAVKGVDVKNVTHVTYNSIVEAVEDNVYEQAIYDKLKSKLKGIEGTISVAINNYMGYKTVEDVVNNCVHISYTAKDSNVTYYTNGDEIRTIEK